MVGGDIYLYAAACMAGCCLMDFPESLTQRTGRHSLSRTIQLVFNASGGIGTILKFGLIALAFYAGYAVNVLTGVGLLAVVLVTDRFFTFLVSIAAHPTIISKTLVANFLWLFIGPVSILYFGEKLLRSFEFL